MIAECKYGAASEVANMLDTANDVSVYDLTAALINALNRIAILEQQIQRAKQ